MNLNSFREIAQRIQLPPGYPRPQFNEVANPPEITIKRSIEGASVFLSIKWLDEEKATFELNISYLRRRNPRVAMLHVAQKEMAIVLAKSTYTYRNDLGEEALVKETATAFSDVVTYVYNKLRERLEYWKEIYGFFHDLLEERVDAVPAYRCAFYDIACSVPSAILKRVENLSLNERETWRTINRNHGGAVQASFNYFLRIYYRHGVEGAVISNLDSCQEELQNLNVHPFPDVGANVAPEGNDEDEDEDSIEILDCPWIVDEEEPDDSHHFANESNDCENAGGEKENEALYAPAPEGRLQRLACNMAIVEAVMKAQKMEALDNNACVSLLLQKEERQNFWLEAFGEWLHTCVDVPLADSENEVREDAKAALFEIADACPLAFLSDPHFCKDDIANILERHHRLARCSWELCSVYVQELHIF